VIKNFRGIKEFSYTFGDFDLICLVGRGDTGKSTILKAISYVLYPSWNPTFYDTDFYNCETENPIEIETTLINIPEALLKEDKYGLYIRGVNKETKEIEDELRDEHEKALTIKLEIKKDLEPKWYVVNNRQDSPVSISAYDRAKLNTFIISDYLDAHFHWRRGAPLYSLLKQIDILDYEDDTILVEAVREAKNKIDEYKFKQFEAIMDRLRSKIRELGTDLVADLSSSIDFKDISIKEGRISLHDGNIPFRLKGKGTKRLMSIAIQLALVEGGGILLIDEIEQGLEPDRVKHLVRTLYKYSKNGQIFIATHSQNVIEELNAENILLVKRDQNGKVQCIKVDQQFQDIVRACPEAMYAKRVIVCEGSTEIGICRALDNFRVRNGKPNFSLMDVVYVDGRGSNTTKRAIKLRELGLDVCVFCDSDDDKVNTRDKEEMRDKGIKIFDWNEGNSVEQQVFKDLPWEAVKELITFAEEEFSEISIRDSVKARLNTNSQLRDDWKEHDVPEMREALAEAAKKGEWFKRIDRGEVLGSIIFKYFDQIEDNKALKKQLQNLSNWVDGDG